jgi:hypothetical protein
VLRRIIIIIIIIIARCSTVKGKDKDEVHPRTGHEGPEGE